MTILLPPSPISVTFRLTTPGQSPSKSLGGSSSLPVALGPDSLRFAGILTRKYKLDPIEVPLFPALAQTQLPPRALLLEKVLEAHELAKANQAQGNFSGLCYASNVLLDDDSWTVGTNIEICEDRTKSHCGERSAVTMALNGFLQNRLMAPDAGTAVPPPKVQVLAMSGAQKLMDPRAACPCADCLAWLSTERHFSPDTWIVSLQQDRVTGKPYLQAHTLTQVMTMLGKRRPSVSKLPVSSLPLSLSAAAKSLLEAPGVGPESLYRLMEAAKKAYETQPTAGQSQRPMGAAVLMGPSGCIYPASRFDQTRRWYLHADQLAEAFAEETLHRLKSLSGSPLGKYLPTALKQALQEPAKLQAVAYYGEDTAQIASEESVGRLSRNGKRKDVLVVTIETDPQGNDTLQVRTLAEYAPFTKY